MHTALTLLWGGLLSAVTVAIEISTNNPVKVIMGEKANLYVSYVSKNPPHVTWALADTFASWSVGQVPPPMVSPVFVDRLTINTSTASIAILQTTLADSRNYTVSLTAVDEPLSSQKVTLRVYALISQVHVTVPVDDVKEGDSKTTVICTMTTGTWDTLSWTRDGRAIVGDAHMVIASNELTIQGVVRGDAGTYSCSVKNPFSNGTSQNLLTVYYGPDKPTISIVSPTDPQPARFVLVNSTVNLMCSTSSEPPAQYLWSVGESSDTNVPSSPVLILDRIQLDQAGIYSCIVTNTRLSRTVRTTQMITVYELPQGEPSCSMVSIQDHRVLQLTCSWTGGVPKAEVRWVGLSRKVSALSQLVHNESSPASLSGSNVTCVANHSAAVKYCIVQPVAPLVILSRRIVRETQGNATVTLTCEVRSNPPSIIHWFKGEKVLRSNEKLIISPNSSEIQIRDFSLETDTGNYSCSCRNPLGEDRPSLILTAPLVMGVTVQRLNRTAASIAWEVRGSDVVTSFLVQSQVSTQRARSSSWATLQEAGMAERAVTVTQLQEEQGYSFRVLPLTGTQSGAPSPTQSVAPAIDNRLSAGAIAGIVVGCVVGALLILLLIILLIRCKYPRRKAGTEKQTANKKEQRSDWDRNPQKASERSAPTGVPTTRNAQAKPQRSISNRTQLTIDEWDRTSSVDPKSLYLNGPYTVSNWRSLERMSPGSTAGKMASIGRMPEHSSSQSHLKSPTLTPQNRSATMV